jgi:N-acetylglutamate synthase-like GNAT family acetyltransferase
MLFIAVRPDEKHDEPTLTSNQLRAATNGDLQRIKSFLRDNGLPDLGVDSWIQNFIIAEDQTGNWVGIVGLELYGESCLLRSVAVDAKSRGRGYGRILVNAALGNARAKGLKRAYLLTDDASEYFERLGFQIVDREDVDASVKASLEFTEACPESATVMWKPVS